MSSAAVTFTLQNAATIIASQFNTNYSDIVNYINARNSGSSAWEAVSSSGTLSVTGASTLSSATLSSTLAVTGIGTFSSDVNIAATKKLYLDGGGDTYITELSGNRIALVAGSVTLATLTSNNIDIAGSSQLNLADGSVSLPGAAFSLDVDNGTYRIGSDHWAQAAGGIKVIDFTPTVVTIPVTLTLSSALATTSGGTGATTKLIRTGTYSGTGLAHDVPHGLGATPDLVIISITGSGSNIANFYITGMSGNSHDYNGTNQTNAITAVDGTNITLGANNAVNQNGVSYAFIAIKAQ